MKCPHLSSQGMTGQVISSALDPFLSFPHVVSYSMRYCLRTPCNFEHIDFIGQHSNRRCITLQPNLVVATRLTLYLRILAPHSTLVFPELLASSPQTATVSSFLKILSLQIACKFSGSTSHISLANFFTSSSSYLVSGPIRRLLHLEGTGDTVHTSHEIWHTSEQSGQRNVLPVSCQSYRATPINAVV